jgi:hypothetical protein
MDRNESELLYKNEYINIPDFSSESGSMDENRNEQFRDYYQKKLQEGQRDGIREYTNRQGSGEFYRDDNLLENTNNFSSDNYTSISNADKRDISERYVKQRVTIVSVDSKLRDKNEYPDANEFSIELPRTFTNIKSMELKQLEFPNTDAVINKTNNRIFWRNKEDITLDKIDTVTGTYPVYSVELRVGSYTANSLETEMENSITDIKRQNLIGDFHYLDITLDLDTDIVTFLSLILTQLNNNPFSSTTNTGIVSAAVTSHGYVNGERIHIIGARQFAGIPSESMNTGHVITVINSDTFTFEVSEKAIDTVSGGGNVVRSGRLAPFQFLWGESGSTIAQNIGYALENSSKRIDTSITLIEPLYQAIITTDVPHGFSNTYDYIGKLIIISGSGTIPTLDGIKVITEVLSETEFYIQMSAPLTVQTQNNGATFTLNGNTKSISSLFNYTVKTIIVNTATPHNYLLSDVGEVSVRLSGTDTQPNLDGSYKIVNVPSTTSLIINGELLDGGAGTIGSIPTRNPLTTYIVPITGVEVVGSILRLTVVGHGLQVGEKIKVNNLVTTPNLDDTAGLFAIEAIPDANTIDINYNASSSNFEGSISPYIGTGLISVYMPGHTFNKISSITNGAAGYIDITTELDHSFTTGDTTRIMETNTSPNADGYYTVTVVDSDTFSVPFTPALTSAGSRGIVGMSNNFYLYSATTVGGVDNTLTNSVEHVVRDVIDINNFTYYSKETYSTSSSIGGGNVFISSLQHGFKGSQDNTKNDSLNRSINLQGQDYAFLCNKELSNVLNINEKSKDVFARIQLSESPGAVIFNDFLAEPKLFLEAPLSNLTTLKFQVKYFDGSFYEFNDLDWSFAMRIVELVDATDQFNMSSKRGVIDYSSSSNVN